MSKKEETSIHIANGGNHSPVNYRKAKQMLLTHPYTLGRLYHIVLTGSEDRKVYRKAVELLCKQLRTNGMPCRYKACYERDKFKRFHKHIFLLIEAKDFHPDTIIHYRKGHWLTEMLAGLKLGFKIAPPQDPMHQVAGKQVNYAYVPKKAGAKLDDCLVWISYLTKVRSKAGVEGQIYTGSTNREPKSSLPIAALPAAKEETIPETKTEGDDMQLTESGFNYLATQYEHCVDQGLDIVQIQHYLSSKGISRSLRQVKHELDSVFCFTGYSDRHPAPPLPDLAKYDAAITRTPLRSNRAVASIEVRQTDMDTPCPTHDKSHSCLVPRKFRTIA